MSLIKMFLVNPRISKKKKYLTDHIVGDLKWEKYKGKNVIWFHKVQLKLEICIDTERKLKHTHILLKVTCVKGEVMGMGSWMKWFLRICSKHHLLF